MANSRQGAERGLGPANINSETTSESLVFDDSDSFQRTIE